MKKVILVMVIVALFSFIGFVSADPNIPPAEGFIILSPPNSLTQSVFFLVVIIEQIIFRQVQGC